MRAKNKEFKFKDTKIVVTAIQQRSEPSLTGGGGVGKAAIN
jgi:hypothetical protein